MDLLATDPGAWSIIGWMLLLVVCGSVVLWLISTLLLRGGSRKPISPGPGSDSSPD